MTHRYLFTLAFLCCCFCNRSIAQVSGCTDPQSTNYNPLATINDGSCVYAATSLTLTNKTSHSTPLLDEVSGLGFLDGKIWTFADSGNPNDIYRVDSLTNTVYQTVDISNATNVDWEDMTASNDYLFIGDIGNNNGNRQDLKIYRINKTDLTPGATSVTAAVINFSFSDQTSFPSLPQANNFDCEAMLFMNDSIHLFSKNWIDHQTRHYVLPNSPGTRVAQYRETLNAGFLVTSASVQSTGVIALCGYLKDGTKPVSMYMLYDYKNNLLFNGNKRKFDLSTMTTNGQVEGVEFINGAYGFINNEKYTTGANVAAKLKSFNLAPYLPAAFLTLKPVAAFTAGSTTVCANATVNFTDQSSRTPTTWQWSFPGGTPSTSSVQNPQIQYTTPGTYSVTLIAGNALGFDTLLKTNYIVVNAAASASITANGATSFCSGSSVTLNANTGAGLSYLWKNNGANIAGATASAYVANGAGNFTCTVTNSCGSATSNSISVTINPSPSASITANGAIAFCPGGSVTLNANAGAGLTYQWKNNTANIAGATASSYVANAAGNFTCTVTNSCGSATSNSISVTINPLPSASITAGGATSFCSGGSVTLNANTGVGLTYQWKNNTVNIPGATTSSYIANAAGNFTCTVTNSCGSATSNAIAVTINSSPSASITANGATSFCSGGSVTLDANTGAGLTYQWKNNTVNIPGATNSSLLVNGAGNYSCTVTNGCGGLSSNSIAVTVDPLPTANITANGSTSFCSGGSVTLNANSGAGLTYQWKNNTVNIPGATASSYIVIAAGNFDCSVTNGCGSAASNSITVTVDPLPSASITANGSTNICSGESVILNANTGAGLSYQWKNNTVNILGATTSSYAASADGNYTCSVTNACGSISSNGITVTVGALPAAPAIPSGLATVCRNTSGNIYSVALVNGATSYTWSAPTGATISSGQGTNSISVSFANNAVSGNICVYASSACGNSGSTCRAITVITAIPAKPASISGSVLPCPNSSGIVYSCPSVTNASGYNWTVPATATIASGQGTNSITVNFNSTFTTGTIKVASVNCIGSSAFRSLSVAGKPSTPGVVTGLVTGVCAGTNNVAYSIASVTGATGYTWTPPANAIIASGQGTTSITVNFNASFTTGTLGVTANNACGSGSVRNTTIRSVPVTPGTITGNATFCANQTGVNYYIAAVAGATTYNWLVPAGATIASGQNTTSIVVNFGAVAGTVKVRAGNACGNSSYKSKTVSVNCRETGITNEDVLDAVVFPNPGSGHFTLTVAPGDDSKIIFTLRDLEGREIEKRNNLSAGENIVFGDLLANGIYFAEITNDKIRKVIKVIKQD